MNINANMSYREVIPRNLNPEEWIEVEINTGKLPNEFWTPFVLIQFSNITFYIKRNSKHVAGY